MLCNFRLINEGSVVKVEAFGIGSLSSLQYHVKQSWHRRSFRFHLTEQIYLDTLITMQTAEGSIYNANYLEFTFPY